jgi:hypothetical protein
MADQTLLSAYQKADDADIDSWRPSGYVEPKARPQQAEQKPAEPQKPAEQPGFFNSLGKAAGAVGSRFTEGMQQVGEAVSGKKAPTLSGQITGESQDFQPMDLDLPGVGKVTVPAPVVRAAHGAMGALGVVYPFSAAAKSLGTDVAAPALKSSLTDEALQARIAQINEGGVLTKIPTIPGVWQSEEESKKRLELLLLMPYDERVKKLSEDVGLASEVAASMIPGYTMAGKLVGKGLETAKAAGEAARVARIEAVAQAGERVATKPPLALPEHAGPSRVGGAIPQPAGAAPKPWNERSAAERLRALQVDPEAQRAIEEWWQENKIVRPGQEPQGPGLSRVEANMSREELRARPAGGDELRARKGDLSTTGHPYEHPSEPLDEQAIKMAQEYDAAVTDPASKPAWDALARETDRMFDDISKKVKVEKVTGQPYASAEEMNKDIAAGRFKVTTDNSEHPFWSEDENWKFRVVHDYLGHFENKHDFSLKGERDAYLHHVKYLTDPEAKDALQIEIYGQAAANVAHGGVFQEQKAYRTKLPFGEVKPPTRVKAYHGTDKTFDASYNIDNEYGGTWFAENPKTANYYSVGKATTGDMEAHAPQVRPVSLTMRNAAPESLYNDALNLMQGDPLLARELLKSKNFDAVRFEGADTGKGVHYLAFDPNAQAVPHFGEVAAPLETSVEAAKRRIAARFGELKQSLSGEEGAVQLRGSFSEGWEKNKQLINDLGTVGAAYMWEGNRAFKEWSARMVAEFGEQIVPQLKAIYESAQERVGSLVKEGVQSKLTSSKAMLEKAKAGEFAGGWYDDAKAEFDRMFGANADLFSDLVAATSPNMDVKSNISLALKAMEKIMKGERGVGNYFKAEDGFIGAHLQNLNRILDGKPISGPKVGEFARAIKGDRDAVVVDTWMLRAFGMTDMATKVNPTPARVKFIQQAVQDIARELGMDNRQAQAAIWSAQKIASEGQQEIKPLAEMVKDALEGKGLLDREWVFPNKLDETLPSWVTEEGRINLGVLAMLGRAAIGGTLGAMTGEDPESSVRNFLLAAGVSSLLSPKLAKTIIKNMNDPEVRDALKQAVKLQGEQGAINPAPRQKREPLKVTEANSGGSSESRALIRGINSRLEKAGMLERSGVQTHEDTIAAALRSPYRTVEAVLGLDEAKLSLDELAAAKVATKGVRDFVAEDAIQTAARAKLTQDPALLKEAVDKTLLAGKVSQKWADLETAGGRFVEASKIKSQAAVASKYDLDEFSKELVEMRAALAERGKVSDAQLVEMLTNLADRAAAAKIASVASRWPEALWNIYYGLNLMGSPITHLRNMLGNLGGLGMAVVDRGFGELISTPFRAAGKGQNMVQAGETYELVKGIYEAVADSFRGGKDTKGALGYARDAYKSGESIFGVGKESEALRVVDQAMQAGEGTLPRVIQVMSTLAQKNLKFMGGTDEFFKVLSFNGEIRALAQRQARAKGLRGQELLSEINRLIDEPETAMLAQATAFAKENTFTKAFTPGTLGATVEKATTHPFMRVALTPFYRTPMRIAEFSTVHTPILNVLAKQFWSDIAAGGVKANLATAKLATGTAALGLVAWFAMHDYITGDWPSDPKLRATYEEAGWQPRSIYVPLTGKYHSYDNIEPLSTLVSTAANFVQIARDLPEWDVQTLFMAGTVATSKSILSKQWFQGLSDLSDVIEAANRGEDVGKGLEFVHRRLASLIPGAAIGRTFNRMTDDEKRERKLVVDNENPELREFSKLTSIYTQNIPGWGHLIPGTKPRPAMVNMITGEPMPNENTWLGAINPFQQTTFKNDRVLNELVALNGAGLPKEIPRIIGGSQPASDYKLPGDEAKQIKEGVILNDEERQRLGVLLTKEVEDSDGNTLHQSLGELMDSEEYDDASETGKKTLVSKRFNFFLDKAERELREEYPKLDQVIARRQLERGLLKLPKSMEDIKDFARETVETR